MGAPVLSLRSLGMKFGCGMKWTRPPCFRSILIVDVGGHEDLHFGPNAESASHHLRLSGCTSIVSQESWNEVRLWNENDQASKF